MHHLPSFGVEEEFLLVDPETGEPAPRNDEVAADAKRRGVQLQLELSSCQVETTSGVATGSAELGAELAQLRRTAAQAAEASGYACWRWVCRRSPRANSPSPTPSAIGASGRSTG